MTSREPATSQTPPDLLAIGEQVVALARELGAEESAVSTAWSVYTDLAQRDGRIEKAQESRSLQVAVELLVDGRFSEHSTNDLRPEALRTFLAQAVAATRYLEPDPHRRLPDRAQMGAADVGALDLDDPSWPPARPGLRREQLSTLEAQSLAAGQGHPVRSISAFLWDGRIDSAVVSSNGFAHRWQRTSAGYGGTITMEEGDGRLPEAYASYAARHAADLPSLPAVAEELVARGVARLGSGPLPSGRYAMLLHNQAVGGLLRVLLSPLAGTTIYEGRSCLGDKLGKRIAPENLTLIDDPLIPRAPGSQPHTGDGMPATRRPVVEDGVLQTFFLDLYNARRLGMEPTTAGASNLVIPPGPQSPEAMLAGAGPCIRVEGFLGGNSSTTTGDFSFGIHGTLLEGGRPARAISEMNVSGNLFTLLERYRAAADDVWTYGAWRVPSLLFEDIQFSGT